MKVKIKKPKDGLEYKPDEKPVYKTTSFRLPADLLKSVDERAEESKKENNAASTNDLVRQIFEWALQYREFRK